MVLAAALGHPALAARRRGAALRYALLGAGASAAGYGAYRLYHSQSAAGVAAQARRLRAALAAYAEAFGTGADTLQLLLADLAAFLRSDRTEVPGSLRQLARLMQSPEVADTTSATVAALVRGVTGGLALVFCWVLPLALRRFANAALCARQGLLLTRAASRPALLPLQAPPAAPRSWLPTATAPTAGRPPPPAPLPPAPAAAPSRRWTAFWTR